jgi:hypothetical protein
MFKRTVLVVPLVLALVGAVAFNTLRHVSRQLDVPPPRRIATANLVELVRFYHQLLRNAAATRATTSASS